MGTRTLSNIHNDIKHLITAITSFEESEEGFRICEKFCMTNIKHHRFLSVNANATNEAIKAVILKLSIHGKYDVAQKLEELVDTFLSSFDFEHHPQYDLQWYLLTLLLDLSKETHTSNLECLKLTRGEYVLNTTTKIENDLTEEIDWVEYLKEGLGNFFCDYKSDTESEWSDETDEDVTDLSTHFQASANIGELDKAICVAPVVNTVDILSAALDEELKSRNWLSLNVQNTWWNQLDWRKYPVNSKFCDAHLCEIWYKATKTHLDTLGTLSEYQASRELLWMFHVQSGMVVFQQSDENNFFVRPDISIPSLTTVAFNSILSPFCEYFSMLYDIEQFGIELYSIKTGLCKKPPLTYEAYNAIVRQHVIKFKNELINIEKDVMKQDDSNTFLTLSAQLKKHLCAIKVLHDVHKTVISDWRTCPNWESASKLLSRLYFEVQKSHNRERTNICASLFLSSLVVYLNIIDTWLSEGRFEDWRDEFIIVKVANDEPSQNNGQYEAFSVRCLDDICLEDPIMQFLIKKVQPMGQNIELLVSLDRITDIWKINTGEDEARKSLVNEFYTKLEAEISKYSSCELQEEAVSSECQIDGISRTEYDEGIEKNTVQQLSEFHNPFLLKALEDFLPTALLKTDTVDAGVSNIQNTEALTSDLFERLEKISKYILPFRKIFENTLAEILVTRYNSASKLVKKIMTEEYKLESQLTLTRSVYMMEAGHIMSKFYQILFHEIETNQMWSNSYFLSCILEEILSQQWPDSSPRWSVTVSETTADQVLTAVDDITLHYAVGWPMNIMLNEKTFEKYNEIFRFQLKLKWALWTLNNLRFCDLEGTKTMYKRNKLEQFNIRRLESVRFWLLHAIGSIHAYLSGQVLQNLGLVLEKALTEAESLDVIISVHNEYLRKVHEHCLLTTEFEDLMATINNLIEMCSHLQNRWKQEKLMFAAEELDILESSYVKYHTYLALALHNAVQNKDANYYKLFPRRQINGANLFDESSVSANTLNDYSRSLLTEVAYQYLPPSGLTIPIPKIVHRTDWYRSNFSSGYFLPYEVTLNEYEQTFSYIRWYQREEHFITFDPSSYLLRSETEDLSENTQDSDIDLS